MTDQRMRSLLERAVRDPEMLAEVPPIIAFAFGVIPIQRSGSTLTVACFWHASRVALRALRKVLDTEVVAIAFDPAVLQPALASAYPAEASPAMNYATFTSPDFLEDPKSLELLRESKVERVGAIGSHLDVGRVVLASLTYHGRLYNLEHPRHDGSLPDPKRTKFELKDGDLAWTLDPDGAPVTWTERDPEAPPAALLLNEFRFSDHRNLAPGALYAEHGTRGTALPGEAFPHVIHPTEVQLLRVDEDGALVFHDYDREERVAAGATEHAFSCRYFFLSLGQRLRREIDVVVHESLVLPHSRVRRRSGSPPWSPRELARWFRA